MDQHVIGCQILSTVDIETHRNHVEFLILNKVIMINKKEIVWIEWHKRAINMIKVVCLQMDEWQGMNGK